MSPTACDDRIDRSTLTLRALIPDHWSAAPQLAPPQLAPPQLASPQLASPQLAHSPQGSLDRQLTRWADAQGLLPDARARQALAALDLEAFARMVLPECPDPRWQYWLVRYTLWLYCADDQLEALTAGEHTRAHQIISAYMGALSDVREGRRWSGTDRLAEIFAGLTAELVALSEDPCVLDKWCDGHRRYWYQGVLMEGLAGCTTLERCLRRKPAVTAVQVYFDIVEATGQPLPAVVRRDPAFRKLCDLGALIDGVFNDVLSYDKERGHAVHSNVALSMRQTLGSDAAALRCAMRLHNALVPVFDAYAEQLLARHRSRAPSLPAYIRRTRGMLAGLAWWQLGSGRYRNRHRVVVVPALVEEGGSTQSADIGSGDTRWARWSAAA